MPNFYFIISGIILLLFVESASSLTLNHAICEKIYIIKNADVVPINNINKILDVQFQNPIESQVQTENLIRYLSLLIDDQQMNTDHLQLMLKDVDLGVIQNPISAKMATAQFVMRIIQEGIQSVLDSKKIDVDLFKTWAENKIREKTKEQERRDKSDIQTEVAALRADFNLIQPSVSGHSGHFVMGAVGKTVLTKITKPFEMMQTLFTQSMWARIQVAAGETNPDIINPSAFKTGSGSRLVDIHGVELQMKPDHPVEQVNWETVMDLLGKINQMSGSGNPEHQTLLEEIFIGHQKGDHYDLPTEAQWEFVLRNRGQDNEKYVDSNSEAELLKYAWYFKNSNNETQAVARLLPRMVDGHPFYDLEGNVKELVRDAFQEKLPGGEDPLVECAKCPAVVVRGGGYLGNARSLESRYRFKAARTSLIGTAETGFRLIRVRTNK